MRAFRCSLTASILLLCIAASAVEIPSGFIAETLATNLNAATALAPAPDGRIFIADQTGRVLIWKNGRLLDPPALTLPVTDYWERGLIGLTLDPDFPRAPHLFALYVTDKLVVHHVLSRFTVTGDSIDAASERILFEGDNQAKLGGVVPAGHQGGPLRFSQDRLLVSIGEQTAGEPAQKLDTLQGKILRLNPDGSIPNDNPFFATTTGKYRAIYALGVRNCFGIAVQPETGRVFFTDVGGSAFEEVNELEAGANYGWPRAEGFSTNSAFKNPLHAYSPLIGQSIVGGVFVPRSSRWPEKWRGKFLFADFMKHWIKALDPLALTNVLTFARGLNGPVATELAPDGSLLVLNRGAIWRDPQKFVPNAGSLVRIRYVGESALTRVGTPDATRSNTNTAALGLPMEPDRLPRKITRADWEQRIRRARPWPIWISSRPWHLLVSEAPPVLYLPVGATVNLSETNRDVTLPAGAVIVRNFQVNHARTNHSIAKDSGGPGIETRLLVIGKPYSYGASYRWRSDDEAELVEDGELSSLAVLLTSAREKTSGEMTLNWWFPGVDDAISFPITNPSYWLSTAPSDFVAAATNRSSTASVNALVLMWRQGALVTSLASNAIANIAPGLNWEDSRAPLENRVRSYLHGNCAVCHQPGGASRGLFDARITTPIEQAGILNGALAAGDLGVAGAKVVVPGLPEKSILLRRLKDTGFFRMPPVQYHNDLSPIVPVIEKWIRSLNPASGREQVGN
jgi:glucose/arabinose dehydrogenase